MGLLPYEEYFPCAEELAKLEKKKLALYETYRELMCHFYICLDLHSDRGAANNLKVWVNYLFLSLDGPIEGLQTPMKDKRIARA